MAVSRGLVKARKHLFGRQAAFGTPVAATKAYLLSGVPEVELNWTDPEVDAGALVTVSAPHREAPDLTAPLDIPQLRYNYLPKLHSGFFGGQVVPTGGGTAKTWTYAPSAVAPLDELDPFTYEFGDDVLEDWYQLTDGVLESFEISIPVGLGACTGSEAWRFGSVASTGSTDSPVVGSVPTDLDPVANEAVVYGKDLAIYIADTEAGLAANQIMDALYSGTIRVSGDLDLKRYANGTQTFEVSAVARANIMVEYEFRFAKTEDIVGTGSESDDWMSDQSVDRYMRLVFTSTVEAQGGTPFSWSVTSPTRYYTRTEDAEGGNTVVVLTARAWYDAVDLEGFYNSVIVTTLTEAELGEAGS
jgi:hypothetical protein